MYPNRGSIGNSAARKVLAVMALLAVITACADNSSTTTTEAPTTTLPAVTCDATQPCGAGDTGPGGGIIFYASTTTFKCGPTREENCNFLEAAGPGWAKDMTLPTGCSIADPAKDPMCPWGNTSSSLNSSNLVYLGGAGYANSLLIIARSPAENTASRIARSYQGGGQSDWYLPSTMELLALCEFAHGQVVSKFSEWCDNEANTLDPRFSPGGHWTSNVSGEASHNRAFFVALSGDRPYSLANRDSTNYVRPVRAFGGSVRTVTATTVKATTTTVRAITTTTVRTATTNVATTLATRTTSTVATTTLAPTTTSTVAPTTTIRSCAQGGSCVVGDTGPGGGTVYFVSSAGFSCGASTARSTCNYLETSPTNWKASTGLSANCVSPDSVTASCVWGTANPTVDTSGAVGAGFENNRQITLNVGVLSAWATVVARAYQGGGKTDWHLPSQHELGELCKYANGKTTGDKETRCSAGTIITGFTNHVYWSSNDSGNGTAIAINFSTGAQTFPLKTSAYLIRPIRAF